MRVREGQGVVLLCGPPSHSGGKMAHRVVAFIAVLQLESFPLRANILTPRSRRVSAGFAQKYWRRAITSPPYLLRIYRDEVEGVLFVGVVEVSGVSHFYSASLWPVRLVLCWNFWYGHWRREMLTTEMLYGDA